MLTERRQPLASWISWAASICVALGCISITGCDRPTASDTTTPSPPTSTTDAPVAGAFLHADPNPVPSGTPNGKTTITWATGSDAVGDVYVVGAGKETLFASGTEGSQDAPWIHPGSNEFRLYKQEDRKLLAQLTVTMPLSDATANKAVATPISSPSP
jgi:hypothetical protein